MTLIASLLSLLVPVLSQASEVDPIALQELRTATRSLVKSKSYHAWVQVEATVPLPEPGAGKVVLDAFRLEDLPIRMSSEELEAYRGNGKIAYRDAGSGDPWKVALTRMEQSGKPLKHLQVMSALPLPHELLVDLGEHLQSLKKSPSEEVEGQVIYEGLRKGDRPSLLVVILDAEGALVSIEQRPPRNAPSAGLPRMSWTFRVDQLDQVRLTIPTAVQELLKKDS